MRVLPLLKRTSITFLRGGRANNHMRMNSLRQASVNPSLTDRLPPLDRETHQRRIVLVRHGETDWNKRGLMQGGGFDIQLNENGKRQAQCVAHEFINAFSEQYKHVTVVASSHLQRASQTADIIHRHQLGQSTQQDLETITIIPRVTIPELGEMRFGALEGMALKGPEATPHSRELFRDHNNKMTQDANVCWPGEGGESTADVEARGLRALDMLQKKYPDADLWIIVAHGRFNKILLASLLYGNVLKHSQIEQGNTCINVMDQRKDGQYDAVVLNYLNHLDRECDGASLN